MSHVTVVYSIFYQLAVQKLIPGKVIMVMFYVLHLWSQVLLDTGKRSDSIGYHQ